MLENSIICVPVAVKDTVYHEIRKLNKYDKEAVSFNAVATYVFRFIHAPSQTHIDVEVRGEGNDSLDKASYKAATGALKYAIRQAFLIETGDDPDDSQEQKEAELDRQNAIEEKARKTLATYKSDLMALKTASEFYNYRDSKVAFREYLKANFPSVEKEAQEAEQQTCLRLDLIDEAHEGGYHNANGASHAAH